MGLTSYRCSTPRWVVRVSIVTHSKKQVKKRDSIAVSVPAFLPNTSTTFSMNFGSLAEVAFAKHVVPVFLRDIIPGSFWDYVRCTLALAGSARGAGEHS